VTYAARTKYDEPGRAARYRDRSPRREEAEGRLLDRLVRGLSPRPASAWDVPCGTGRLAARLLQGGIPTRGGDLSPAMRAEAEARLGGQDGWQGAVPMDLEAVPAGTPPADLVVCLRFLHHLPDAAARARVLAGLRRLTGRDLLLSFHHPVSVHHLRRWLRTRYTGRRSDRHVIAPARLRREAEAAGFAWRRAVPLARWRRELWIAHLQPAATAPAAATGTPAGPGPAPQRPS
jgi:SAM-dependent methyltransferase